MFLNMYSKIAHKNSPYDMKAWKQSNFTNVTGKLTWYYHTDNVPKAGKYHSKP